MQITEENFKQIDPQLLLDPKRYQDIEDMVVSISAAGTADYAQDYVIVLADKLDKIGEQMPRELFDRYLKLLSALRLFSLRDVKDEEKERFFREQIIDVFKLDFVDIQFWMEYLLRPYWDSPEIISELRQSLTRGLESNLQKIGNEDLVVPGFESSLHPTILNWLKDYRAFTPLGKNQAIRSSLDQLSYVNQSVNVRKIAKPDRDLLFRIIKLDDWLRYAEVKYNFSFPGQAKIPDQTVEGEQHKLIPEELLHLVNQGGLQTSNSSSFKLNTKPRPSTPPAVPKNLPTVPRPPVPHGQDLEVLRKQMEKGRVDFTPVIKMTPQEIKREVDELELPAHQEVVHSSPRPVALASLNDIKAVDDLKKIELAHLRQAPLYNQAQLIKSKILFLAQVNNLIPYYTVNAFEKSPLFQLYLKVGAGMIADQNVDRGLALKDSVAKTHTDLTLQEFEAIADLRKDIERL